MPTSDLVITISVTDDQDNEIFKREVIVPDIPSGNLQLTARPDPMGPAERTLFARSNK